MTDASPRIIELHEPSGGSARVTAHGGHVLSWRPAGDSERLFLSPDSRFDAGASIRGGIPIIFPQFGAFGPLPKHGFARTRLWTVGETGPQHATLILEDDAETRQIWPHAFRVSLQVRLSADQLTVGLQVDNTGEGDAMRFTAALHTYLRVADISSTGLVGLANHRYWDATADCADERQAAPVLRFVDELDRVYLQTPHTLTVDDGARRTNVEQQGFADTVVWNPGPAKAAAMDDMPPDGHRQMLCVEAAQVGQPIELPPGQRWRGTQVLHRVV